MMSMTKPMKTTITTVVTTIIMTFLVAAKFLMIVAALMTMAMELAAMVDSMVTFIATVVMTMDTLLKSWSPTASTLEAVAWIVLLDDILELFIMHTSREDEAAPEVAASDSTQKVDPPTKEAAAAETDDECAYSTNTSWSQTYPERRMTVENVSSPSNSIASTSSDVSSGSRVIVVESDDHASSAFSLNYVAPIPAADVVATICDNVSSYITPTSAMEPLSAAPMSNDEDQAVTVETLEGHQQQSYSGSTSSHVDIDEAPSSVTAEAPADSSDSSPNSRVTAWHVDFDITDLTANEFFDPEAPSSVAAEAPADSYDSSPNSRVTAWHVDFDITDLTANEFFDPEALSSVTAEAPADSYDSSPNSRVTAWHVDFDITDLTANEFFDPEAPSSVAAEAPADSYDSSPNSRVTTWHVDFDITDLTANEFFDPEAPSSVAAEAPAESDSDSSLNSCVTTWHVDFDITDLTANEFFDPEAPSSVTAEPLADASDARSSDVNDDASSAFSLNYMAPLPCDVAEIYSEKVPSSDSSDEDQAVTVGTLEGHQKSQSSSGSTYYSHIDSDETHHHAANSSSPEMPRFFDVLAMPLLKCLGFGSSGVVHLVKDAGEDRALKIVDALDEHTKAQTAREIQMLQLVQGLSSIVQLHGVANQSGKDHLLFELGLGGSLLSRVEMGHKVPIGIGQGYKDLPGLDMRDIRFYSACMIKGIRDLHNLNIVHRDIKLDNIVIARDGRAKIADLGSAEVMEPGQTVHTYKGTPCYMPPELLRVELNMPTEGASRESDWWSAGTAIYEMAFGVSDFPFYVYDQDGAVDWAKTSRRIVLEPFETLSLPKELSGSLKSLLVGLLDPNPKTRLGAEGAARPEDQPFFSGIDWDNLLAVQNHPAPWRPTPDMIHQLPDVKYPKGHLAMRNNVMNYASTTSTLPCERTLSGACYADVQLLPACLNEESKSMT